MSDTEQRVVSELRRIRYSRPPSLNSIARAANISRTELYRIMLRGTASDAIAARIDSVLQQATNEPSQKRGSVSPPGGLRGRL